MLKNQSELGHLDLNLLYTFHVFADVGTLHETATALGRSQPTISARLHQLESELGLRLLTRQGRRLVLTPGGRAVDKQLRAIFSSVRDLADHTRAQKAWRGIVRIGALHTLGAFVLAPKIAQFCSEHPGADFELQYGLARDQLNALQHGSLDLVAGIGNPPSTGFEVVTLGDVRPVLVFAGGGDMFPTDSVAPRQLQSRDLIGYGAIDDPFFGAVWNFLERHQLDTRLRVQVSHIETIRVLIAQGAGIAILPDYTVAGSGLLTRRVEGLVITLPIWIAMRDRSMAIPLLAKFWRFVSA